MTQKNLVQRTAVTLVGLESTFGVPGVGGTQVFPQGESFSDDRQQAELEVEDESVYLHDYKTTVLGLKSGGCKFDLLVKPLSTILDSLAVAPTTSPNEIIAKALFGGELLNPGSLVVASPSPTPTSFSVTPADGAHFLTGQMLYVEVGGVLEPTVVASVSTDAITLALALSSAPSTGAKVVNAANYYPIAGNTRTLTVARAQVGDVNEQQIFSGCTGDLAFGYDRGGLLKMSPDLKCADWQDGALSIPTTYGADPQGPGFALKDAVTLLQPVGTTTKTQYPVTKFSAKIGMGMVFVPEHGGINGNTGVMRTGERMFCEIDLTVRADRDLIGYQTAKTPLRFLHVVPQGAGNTKRFAALHLPRCIVVGTPKPVVDGGRRLYNVKLRSQIDTTGGDELSRAPLVWAVS